MHKKLDEFNYYYSQRLFAKVGYATRYLKINPHIILRAMIFVSSLRNRILNLGVLLVVTNGQCNYYYREVNTKLMYR